jgi:hypothetical protein
MPIGNYSTGRDLTLIVVASGGLITFPGLLSFRSKQDTSEKAITKIDGVTDHVRFFQGWSWAFTLERTSSVVDKYFNQLEANYYVGITELPAFIQEIALERDGTLSSFLYEKVLLKLDDAGEWAGDKTVTQAMSFIASRRKTQ